MNENYTAIDKIKAYDYLTKGMSRCDGLCSFSEVIKGYVLYKGDLNLPSVINIFSEKLSDISVELVNFQDYMKEHECRSEDKDKFHLQDRKKYFLIADMVKFVDRFRAKEQEVSELINLLVVYIEGELQENLIYIVRRMAIEVEQLGKILRDLYNVIFCGGDTGGSE